MCRMVIITSQNGSKFDVIFSASGCSWAAGCMRTIYRRWKKVTYCYWFWAKQPSIIRIFFTDIWKLTKISFAQGSITLMFTEGVSELLSENHSSPFLYPFLSLSFISRIKRKLVSISFTQTSLVLTLAKQKREISFKSPKIRLKVIALCGLWQTERQLVHEFNHSCVQLPFCSVKK